MEQHSVPTEPLRVRIQDVLARHGDPPWMEQVMDDGLNQSFVIGDRPGGSMDAHWHHDFNEWWIIWQGDIVYELGDYDPIHTRKSDMIVCPIGKRHQIRTVGDGPSVRMVTLKPNADNMPGERSSQLEPLPDQKLPPNLLRTNMDEMLEHFGEPPWVQTVIDNDRNRVNLICQAPGMTNDAHWHPDFDEWWAVLRGELTWEVGKNRPLIDAKEGDLVFVPRGMRHHITTVGNDISLRLAVTTPGGHHVYTDDDQSAPPPRE